MKKKCSTPEIERNPISADLQNPAGVFTPPEYTWKEIHEAIPKHCFERDTLLSLGYVLRDFAFVGILSGSAFYGIPMLGNVWMRGAAWSVYAFFQGLVFTGLWELAHECGHGALSPHKWANDCMGLTIHSLLLVPYHSWRITHSHHHKATNNLSRDIAFVPSTKAEWDAKHPPLTASSPILLHLWATVEDTPFVALVTLFFHQLIAFPIYLTLNNFALERMAEVSWWKRSHFYLGGDGPNFKPANGKDVLKSDIGIACMALALWWCVGRFGAWQVFVLYGAPYLWTNHWILTITYLQHTSPTLPYYSDSSHNFLRGAASTIDRDFGFIGRHFFHGAIDTHVLHHHASRIPFYHAVEASEALKKVMGHHYQKGPEEERGVLGGLAVWWRDYRACLWVGERVGQKGEGVYFFGEMGEDHGDVLTEEKVKSDILIENVTGGGEKGSENENRQVEMMVGG